MATPRRVLTVCTANACRSPVAERLLQREWEQAGGEVTVRSAGVSGGGYRVPPQTMEAASIISVDLSDHVSRRLTAELIRDDGADLIIGMTREHLRAAIEHVPECFGRAFTMRELVRRTASLAEPPADWDSWLAACHEGRTLGQLVRPDVDDDLPDPIGHPVGAHILMVQDVTQMARRLAPITPWP